MTTRRSIESPGSDGRMKRRREQQQQEKKIKSNMQVLKYRRLVILQAILIHTKRIKRKPTLSRKLTFENEKRQHTTYDNVFKVAYNGTITTVHTLKTNNPS